MIKPISEMTYVTMQGACRYFPARPHINTVKRWCVRGYDGHILESCKHGNRRMTSEEWIDEFLAKINGTQVEPKPSVSHTEAERALDAMGVN